MDVWMESECGCGWGEIELEKSLLFAFNIKFSAEDNKWANSDASHRQRSKGATVCSFFT